MSEEELLSLVFSKEGLIAQSLGDYEEREGQKAMAEQILKAYQNDTIALTEAGTGIGKSLAYLAVCMLWAQKHKQRTVISTHTIALQHQLIEKDIPFLKKALDFELKAILVKGMQNYLCLRKLEEMELDLEMDRDSHLLKVWAEGAKTGCRSTLPFTLENGKWERFAADPMSCTSSKCPHFRSCFFYKARKEAEEAQLVVVNHHLLLTAKAEQDETSKSILPEFYRLVIDEAHRLEEAAMDIFSNQCDWIGLIKHINSFSMHENAPLDFLAQKTEILRKLEKAFFLLREQVHQAKMPWQEKWCDTMQPVFAEAAEEMLKWAVMWQNQLVKGDSDPLMSTLAKRLEEEGQFLRGFFELKRESIRWVEREENTLRLIETPLDIPEKLKAKLFGTLQTAALCSATLCQGKDFSFVRDRLGLETEEEISEAVFPSPFDYEGRMFFAAASDLPEPSTKEFAGPAIQAIGSLLQASRGGVLVLFTAVEMMHEAFEVLRRREDLKNYTFLRQGELGRAALLKRFTETKRAVLMGVDSFWEGLDLTGLGLVIIVKLPFHPLGDPLIDALQRIIEKNGGNPFFDYSVPKAVMKFKQAFGRLMRKKEDRGAVVCLDKRIYTKNYGKKFLDVLPSCPKFFATVQEIKIRIGA